MIASPDEFDSSTSLHQTQQQQKNISRRFNEQYSNGICSDFIHKILHSLHNETFAIFHFHENHAKFKFKFSAKYQNELHLHI